MTSATVDVAIIGAGAAGAAAACAVAPGASVALIDRVATPQWRIGESLPGAAHRLLKTIGAWPRFVAAQHGPALLKISRWGSDRPVELDPMRDPDGAGWHLDRARFEADLRATALDHGAVFHHARVRTIARTPTGWSLSLDNGTIVAARRLIDASGRRSRLLAAFGQHKLVVDRLACVYARISAGSGYDPVTYTHAVESGWWYTAVLPGGERLVSFHCDSDNPALRATLKEGPLAAALRVPGLAGAIGRIERSHATAPEVCAANTIARSAAGDGWLAAGDAAMALDPLSSQGLFNALATGLEAGDATLALLAGDDAATPRFAERMRMIWQAYLRHHALYYGMERRWPQAEFWSRRPADAGSMQ
jgi:flavin-dependent dehydrogenase